jgi:hypothetical protein
LNQRQGNEYWIGPLLKRLDLVHKADGDSTRDAYWKQIEECGLADCMGRLVSEVNRAAGYHILEMVEFLPPQKNVLRVSFRKSRVKHNLEVAIRDSGLVLMFSTTRLDSTIWGRYVSAISNKRTSSLVWEETIIPEELLEQHVQAWVSYLLSGLDKKFRLDQILESSANAESGFDAALRKLSA